MPTHPGGSSTELEKQVRVPWFPRYSWARLFAKVLDGKSVAQYAELVQQLDQLKGSPAQNEDFSDPDDWIQNRLTGDAQDLAWEIWLGSDRKVNPYHTRGSRALLRIYNLIEDLNGTYVLTERGRAFVAEDPNIEREIDEGEGLIRALEIIAARGPGQRRVFLDDWKEFLASRSGFQAKTIVSDSWRRRVRNLAERRLVDHTGTQYQISNAGLTYLSREVTPGAHSIQVQILALKAQARRDAQRMLLDELRALEPPHRLQTVVRRLLEAMGYEQVDETPLTNDGGVDLIAYSQLYGITKVCEAVQVKRHASNLSRPVIDQLRGVLHKFKALRGIIVTTGGFSQGAREAAEEFGAPPITLIDGSKLVELLIQNNIGAVTQTVEVVSYDRTSIKALLEGTDD